MSRADLAENTCTVARAIELFGDAWMLMILRETFLGNRRFDDLQRQTGASPHLLSRRLKRLQDIGVLRREAYSEHPARYDYLLTAMGRDLWPVIISIKSWGDKWLGEGPHSINIQHKSCGHVVVPQMTCPACHKSMEAYDAQASLSEEFELERDAIRSPA
ncbi:MAG: helix-turn-helix domain-containing protein [Alphaproteobacteria bacterium]|nr:helix-turn-helix domain-containing protein [Alphaproteobacteria bacterium]